MIYLPGYWSDQLAHINQQIYQMNQSISEFQKDKQSQLLEFRYQIKRSMDE